MSLPDWIEQPIDKKHDRIAFDCGEQSLNEFFQKHARQNHERGAAKTFVAVSKTETKTVLGFYSLCPGSLDFARVPSILSKGLARHDIPVYRLVRLAVRLPIQGHGLGGQLILAAGRRCLKVAAEVGGVALLIDAKNERSARWYQIFGAVPLSDEPLSLILPLSTLKTVLDDNHLK